MKTNKPQRQINEIGNEELKTIKLKHLNMLELKKLTEYTNDTPHHTYQYVMIFIITYV